MFNNVSELDAVEYRLSIHGLSHELSDHFRLIEFASGDGADVLLISHELIDGLEALRIWAGAPVRINSGYRSPPHNAAIGGVPNSRHTKGLASDVDVMGKTPAEVATWAEDNGFGGVGRYNTFTHVDVFSENRRWDKTT